MNDIADKVTLKTVGANGQISFGKKYAGRHVLVEEQGEGVWIVKTARVIPDNEAWFHTPEMQRRHQAALKWAETHKKRTDNAEEILKRLEDAE